MSWWIFEGKPMTLHRLTPIFDILHADIKWIWLVFFRMGISAKLNVIQAKKHELSILSKSMLSEYDWFIFGLSHVFFYCQKRRITNHGQMFSSLVNHHTSSFYCVTIVVASSSSSVFHRMKKLWRPHLASYKIINCLLFIFNIR